MNTPVLKRKITDKRHVLALTLLCSVAYFVSYLTRKDFSAVLVAFAEAEGIEKTAVSAVPVTLFICYGIGQLVSGWLGDRISPRRLLTGGLLLTTVINIIVPVWKMSSPVSPSDILRLTVLWGVNGFAQALMWPPMVKIMTDLLTPEDYRRSCVTLSLGSSLGTMGIYLISALLIKLTDNWRSVFFFSALCGAVMAFVWEFGVGALQKYAKKSGTEFSSEPAMPSESADGKAGSTGTLPESRASGKTRFNPFAASPIILIMLAIIFQGMLRDGLEQWMPSFLAEGYGLETSGAILSSVVMPIFTFLCIKAAAVLYDKRFSNQLSASAFLFSVALASTLVLFLLFRTGIAWIGIVLISLAAGTMHGINLMLISYVPSDYEKYGNVSFISGLLNFCTYIGSAIFTYGIAKIAEVWDWNVTILSWALVALLGLAVSLACVRRWERFKNK